MTSNNFEKLTRSVGREPVAIIGFSFRFGDDAVSPDKFWDMILDARTTRAPIPQDRFNAEVFYHPDTDRLDRLPVKYGNFLSEDIAAFDAPFFRIKPEEAAAMDPKSRKLLEATYRALENAGLPIEKCAKTNTCVFTGISSDDYRLMYVKDTSYSVRHAATGMAPSMLANKISWFFDFKGPSMQLDTACSSSLNALHLAFRSLQSGESTMGIVGGANLYLTPESMAPLAHLNFFSPDSRCYSFDHRASGYTRGDGYGVFILKPLSRALADADPIRAIIMGTASNENGTTTGGITKVNLDAQQILIRTAYLSAGVSPSLTRFCEAHAPGTGGDIVEATALASVFSPYRSKASPLYMGSVKANVGHLEGTSGIASLVKVILMLERGVIPKLANFERLHPDIHAGEWHMDFPVQNVPWPDGLRQASINSFGFGGANAHVVIQDARSHNLRSQPCRAKTQPMVLVLSAADWEALARMQKGFEIYFSQPGVLQNTYMRDLAFTLSQRRSRLPWKSALVVSVAEVSMTLANHLWSSPIRSTSSPPLAFIFTGQGAAWARMGMHFFHNSTFHSTLQQCSTYLAELGSTWDLIEELSRYDEDSRIRETAYSQPLCTAIQIALVDMLRSFGVVPNLVLGHSSGEIAAAAASGAISAKTALKIAYFRGQVVAQNLPTDHQYGMLAVGLGEEKIAPHMDWLRRQFGRSDTYLACINSPRNVTLSGISNQLLALKGRLEDEGVFVRLLPVTAPYHCPIVAQFATEYQLRIGSLERGTLGTACPQMISSVTSQKVNALDLLSTEYWVKNLVSPVQFRSALDALAESSDSSATSGRRTSPSLCLVEIGPHGVLRAPVRDTLASSNSLQAVYFSTMDRGASTADRLYHSLGQLHCLGYPVDLMALNDIAESEVRCLTDLPEYPFNNEIRYWHESPASRNFRFRKHAHHDLLGVQVNDWNPLAPRWRHRIRILENPWIQDHRLAGALIYPGAGFLVMAIEAAAQYVHDIGDTRITGFHLTNVLLHSSLNLAVDAEGVDTEFSLVPNKGNLGRTNVPFDFAFKILALMDGLWREVCEGNVAVELDEHHTASYMLAEAQHMRNEQRERFHQYLSYCTAPISRHKLYQSFKKIGLDVGPTFQVFDDVRRNPQEHCATARVRLANWTSRQNPEHVSDHFVHPTALDGLIQLVIVALGAGTKRHVPTMIPSRIDKMYISAEGLTSPHHITAVASSSYHGLRHTISEVLACDTDTGQPRVSIDGLQTTIIESENPKMAHMEELTMLKITWIACDDHTEWEAFDYTDHEKTIVMPITCAAGDEISILTHDVIKVLRDANVKAESGSLWQDGLLSVQDTRLPTSKAHFVCLCSGTETDNVFRTFHLLLPVCRSIMWVTLPSIGPPVEGVSVHGAAVGLARTLRNEEPDCQFITLNLERSTTLACQRSAIIRAFQPERIARHVSRYEPEFQYGPFDSDGTPRLQVPRLVSSEEDARVVNVVDGPARSRSLVSRKLRCSNSPALKLDISSPGLLDTLQFVQNHDTGGALQPSEIVIEPAWTGLNFLDVLTALGRIPQNAALGIEGAGVVVEAGTDSDLRLGDRVAVLTNGTLRTRVRTHYLTAIALPENLSFRDAAAMIGTSCTAYRAFVDIARLEKGETVLIHAGAGATGQMAVQMAQYLRAVIYLTVGSDKKRELMQRNYSIPPDHIFNSRDASFITAMRRMTGGRGVDVVLNSLAGDLLHSAWAQIMAPFGRWVEIGKRDIIGNSLLGMAPFMDNVTFSCVDLTGIWQQRPPLMRRLLSDVMKLMKNRTLRSPLPVSEFLASDIQGAFRTLQNGRGGGKVVVDLRSEQEVCAHITTTDKYLLRRDRSYLITGGLGGLGRQIARWMANRGARFLILISRSGIGKNSTKTAFVHELTVLGCIVEVLACDVANESALRTTLKECERTMPPIAGCVHASMILQDRFFKDMTLQAWKDCTSSKIDGSQNLDKMLPVGLDFFIFMSSLVGVVGAVGQSNYAAGNAFQDSLARDRVSRGEKAISLDLGMFVDEGAVFENQDLARTMESYGHYQPMFVHHLEALLDLYCDPERSPQSVDDSQVVCGIRPPVTIRARGLQEPAWLAQPMFEALHGILETSEVSHASTTLDDSLRGSLEAAKSMQEATTIVTDALVMKLATSLGVASAEIDVSRPLHVYGVDSLAATELRNWFANNLKADVAILHILGEGSITLLADLAARGSPFTLDFSKTVK